MIGGKPGVASRQGEKRDQAAAISIGHHAAVRAVARRLRLESAQSEEIMQEPGPFVDHSTIHRWVIKLVPVLEEAFRKRNRKRGIGAVVKSWRLDEPI